MYLLLISGFIILIVLASTWYYKYYIKKYPFRHFIKSKKDENFLLMGIKEEQKEKLLNMLVTHWDYMKFLNMQAKRIEDELKRRNSTMRL